MSERLDPASLQVLISRLTGIAEEMGAVLRRAAFSPNIKERADCSAALFTPAGELLVQAEHIPVHLGSMPASVAAAIAAVGVDALGPGDQVILNDPFAGGTHLNDITLVAPCFDAGGRLLGWAANRAHHADVGGMAPGSIPPEATEIQQEGLRIPPVRLTPEVVALLRANSRTPVERQGDLEAQLGANAVGVTRLAAFAGAPLDEVLDYGERRMRAALGHLPDGVYRFSDVLDSSGPSPEQQRPVRIEVAVEVRGDSITFDFTGSDPQTSGNVNAVEAVTVSCVAFALRSATDPTIPANGGALRPVRIVVEPGSAVAALPPAAVGAGNVEVSQRIADVCLGALAGAAPDRVPAAGQGTMNNVLIGGDGWVYYETVAGGAGGRPGRPGSPGGSGVHTGMTNTLNTPIEALERSFPMRVLRYSLRRGSGGAGWSPGGEGIERDLLMLEDVTVSLITERRRSAPWGLAGGRPGASGENWLVPGGDEARARRLPDKCTVRMSAGDVLRMLTPGGGGWGPPPAIRRMGQEDIAAVRAVERAAGALFRSHPDPRVAACADHDPMSAAVLAEFVAAGRAWVCAVGDEVVGFAVAEVSEGCGHVEELAVAPAWNGSGIGSSLLEAAAEWARSEALSALTLTTFRDVPFNRPWYERRGFRVVPVDEQTAAMRVRVRHEDEAYGLPAELRVVMQRDLLAPVSVRDAVASDLPSITALYNALIPTTTVAWRDHLASDREMADWFAGQQAAGHPVLVAEVDGRVVGYTTWTGFRYSERFPGYRHSMELTIHVDGSVHGRGIGRTLIEALVARGRVAGVHVLVAGADADNTASIAFHSALGFVEVARMPEVGRKFDRWLDLVLMQRIIDAAIWLPPDRIGRDSIPPTTG